MASTPTGAPGSQQNKRHASGEAGEFGRDEVQALVTELQATRNQSAISDQQTAQLMRMHKEQNDLLRQQIQLLTQQGSLQNPGAGHALQAAAPPPPPLTNVLGESNAIKGFVTTAVKEVTVHLNKANAAKQAKATMETLTIDTDPTVPLPLDMPKVAQKVRAPMLTFPAEMGKEEMLKELQTEIDKSVRQVQITFCAHLLKCKNEIVTFSLAQIEAAETKLQNSIKDVLADTYISEPDKQALTEKALHDFGQQKSAEIIKIETRRKADATQKATRMKELEAAKLKQLESNNDLTVGALMDQKISAERVRRGSEEIMVDAVDATKLVQENAAFQKTLNMSSSHSSKNGGAARGPKNSATKSKKKPSGAQEKPSAAKGKPTSTKAKKPIAAKGKSKGKGKGKAANKRGGGRGGH